MRENQHQIVGASVNGETTAGRVGIQNAGSSPANDSLPGALVWPLTDTRWLVSRVAELTSQPACAVTERFLVEQRRLGTNVRKDLAKRGIRPNTWGPELIEFYTQSDAFLYESLAWARVPFKLAMLQWTARRIRQHTNIKSPPATHARSSATGTPRPRVLVYGDGPGFDSLYLARCGFDVTYFEVGRLATAFARALYAETKTPVTIAATTDALTGQTFDAVVCFDVLEHVPSPPELVKELAGYLSPGGLLLVNAPFFLVCETYGTHLASNARYAGDVSLYERSGLELADGRVDWSPIILVKPSTDGRSDAAKANWLHRAGLRFAGMVLRAISFAGPATVLLPRLFAPADRRWLDESISIPEISMTTSKTAATDAAVAEAPVQAARKPSDRRAA